MTKEEYNHLGGRIIGAAIEVHRELGPGLLESVYEECLLEELRKQGLNAKQQVVVPIIYKGRTLNKTFRIDILVENEIILELKCVEHTLPVHEVQLLTYMKLADKKLGYLLNFNVPMMKQGIKRRINGYI